MAFSQAKSEYARNRKRSADGRFLTRFVEVHPTGMRWSDEQIQEFEYWMRGDGYLFQSMARDARSEIAKERRRDQAGRFAKEEPGRELAWGKSGRAGCIAAALSISKRQAYKLMFVYRKSPELFRMTVTGQLSVPKAVSIAHSDILTRLIVTGTLKPNNISSLTLDEVNQIISGYTPSRFRERRRESVSRHGSEREAGKVDYGVLSADPVPGQRAGQVKERKR